MSAQQKKKQRMATATEPTTATTPVPMIEALEGRRLLSASFASTPLDGGGDGGAAPVEESVARVTTSDISFPIVVSKPSPGLAVADADREAPKNPPPPKDPPKIPLTDILISSYN